MKKNIKTRIEQVGSLMIEAMAMLALISMVTPIVYKKAAERTTELQDINEAGHIRIISRALDDYLRDNYNSITGSGQVKLTAAEVNELKAYFPRGFNLSSKLFSDIDFWVNKRIDDEGTPDEHKILTGFLVAKPVETDGLPLMRASRIASMIGTNGGYSDDTANVKGVQGIWEIPKSSLNNPTKGSIVATSIQTIASSAGGEDILYRVDKGRPILNTMETTLRMGSNNIQDINKVIVTGNAVDSIKTAGGIDAIDGHLKAASAKITNLLEAGSAIVDGHTKTGTLEAGTTTLGDLTAGVTKLTSLTVKEHTKTGTLEAGTTTLGDLTAGVTKLTSLTVKEHTKTGTLEAGDTDITGTLDVEKDTTLKSKLAVIGTTTLTEKLTANGGIDTPELNAVTLRGGKASMAATDYNFTASNTDVTIKRGYLKSDADSVSIGADAANQRLYVNKNTVAITTASTTAEDGFKVDTRLKVNQIDGVRVNADFGVYSADAATKILEVKNANLGTTTAGIYMRKGAIEMGVDGAAPKALTGKYTNLNSDTKGGYIRTDRLVGNKVIEPKAISGYADDYDRYQVNPAYTSVMHDIKLSTRGGARLSDILPDFVNKGIYVLDNTYSYCNMLNATNCTGHDAWNWEGITVTSAGVTNTPNSCSADTFLCEASPWLGFLPAPQCPPGYSKVATISPIRWAMAKAYSIDDTDTSDKPVIYQQYARSGANVPFKYQTSTWLNTALKKKGEGSDFYGWSGIMGFIYPGWDYATEIKRATDRDVTSDSEIVWNLFPVYNQELAAIANVYCYFDRSNTGFNEELIDKTYNQLTTIRTGYGSKDSGYTTRLNDPDLKYNSAW